MISVNEEITKQVSNLEVSLLYISTSLLITVVDCASLGWNLVELAQLESSMIALREAIVVGRRFEDEEPTNEHPDNVIHTLLRAIRAIAEFARTYSITDGGDIEELKQQVTIVDMQLARLRFISKHSLNDVLGAI